MSFKGIRPSYANEDALALQVDIRNSELVREGHGELEILGNRLGMVTGNGAEIKKILAIGSVVELGKLRRGSFSR